MRYARILACLAALLMTGAVQAAGHAKLGAKLIDRVPVDVQALAPKNGATIDQFPDQKTTLLQDVQSYLQNNYDIAEQRLYVLQPRGYVVQGDISNFIFSQTSQGRKNSKSKIIGRWVSDHTFPSGTVITIWSVGHDYFALATSAPLGDDNTLYGLFELKKLGTGKH